MNYVMINYRKEDDSKLCYFYEGMNDDNEMNHSRIIWECIRNAPYYDMFQLDKIGMWYVNKEVVTSIRAESPWPGGAVIDNRSNSKELLQDVIRYAEDNMYGIEDNKKQIIIIVNEKGNSLKEELLEQNYELLPNDRGTLHFSLSNEIPQVNLPEGFQLKTLSEVYDFDLLSKVIWEGFNYEGAVPKIDDEVYPTIKHAWLNYNRHICSVVIAPDGTYASFCGFWYDKKTQTGYLEPMITAKEYRKLGLGKAGVYHSLRILQAYGCKNVFVDPDEEPYNYYRSIGFQKNSYTYVYKKVLG